MLFTADLRAFSERLVAKIEAVEEKPVKVEEDAEDGKENVVVEVKKETVLENRVKPEWDDTEHKVVDVHEDMMTRVKRRRLR